MQATGFLDADAPDREARCQVPWIPCGAGRNWQRDVNVVECIHPCGYYTLWGHGPHPGEAGFARLNSWSASIAISFGSFARKKGWSKLRRLTEKINQRMIEHAETDFKGTKIAWHHERSGRERGERIAPITIDMALTRACNFGCHYCYAMLQENERSVINKEVITRFLDDCAEIGVKGVSFVSDGESTISPVFVHACQYGAARGLAMACGTNAYVLTRSKLEEVLPHLTYLRVNISAGEPKRYAEIMGVKEEIFPPGRRQHPADDGDQATRSAGSDDWAANGVDAAVCRPDHSAGEASAKS
jgi:hypothetical protein